MNPPDFFHGYDFAGVELVTSAANGGGEEGARPPLPKDRFIADSQAQPVSKGYCSARINLGMEVASSRESCE